ncbi:FOG: Zn-finger [Moesziomyces antarcticus T-34]|uniref:FOG: Zn-finger n=1 Tax=Pseudozyma antarctica (strain T-34) TaxID=1151754 RepID=M9M7Y3_PSEA3|nr:FOG: Zn-finger [Moesziomyces antarcticus T-34]
MAVAQRYDGVGQHGFGQHYPSMAPPSSLHNFGYDRRSQMEANSEPMWPVPRVQQPLHQGGPNDRSRDAAAFPSSFAQGDLARHQGQQANYTYDGSAPAIRNPVVYSQPAQVPWGLAGQSTADYPEYPTASFVGSMGQRTHPPVHNASSYLGGTNNPVYGDPAMHAAADGYPRVMNGPTSSMGGPYDHSAETLWPLGPNSLDAFAGIPNPSGQVARLTLTSSNDKNKLKARSSLPPPKQFKCSACDAIFSRNHDLKRHARIHLAVKPFPCGYCDKAFSRKDALKRHVLVKGCGIGNKKNDNRKRAATLSKLEHSGEGSNTSRGPYDAVSSESRPHDLSNFRDGLHYQGHQQQEEQRQPGRADQSWPSGLSEGTTASPNINAGYSSGRAGGGEDRLPASQGGQPAHAGTMPPYGSQSQGQQYPGYGMGDHAFHQQQQQRQQLPGGLVNAFASPEATSVSSPSDSQSRHHLGGNAAASADAFESKDAVNQLSRPGSAKLMNSVAYGTHPYQSVESAMPTNATLNAAAMGSEPGSGFGTFDGQARDRFGPGGYASGPMLSPGHLGPDHGNPHAMSTVKRDQQPQFGSYFGSHPTN